MTTTALPMGIIASSAMHTPRAHPEATPACGIPPCLALIGGMIALVMTCSAGNPITKPPSAFAFQQRDDTHSYRSIHPPVFVVFQKHS